jgi:hypothetical protein
MTKKECKDGVCKVNITNFSVDADKNPKEAKKDSSKRLR